MKLRNIAKIKGLLIYKTLSEIKLLCIGFIGCIRLWKSRMNTIIKDHFYEKKMNIETELLYSSKADLSLYKDSVSYYPTPYDSIQKILDYLKLGKEDVFVDLGSGKGRVILLAAARNLKKVIGVELDKHTIDVCKKNLEVFRFKNTPLEIINADVANFIPSEGSVFFMYHPFGYNTLVKVLNNIKESLTAHPRKIRIVYYLPRLYYLLDYQNWLEREIMLIKNQCLIWHSRSQRVL